MASVIFPFRKEKSAIFGEIARPVAKVFFWSNKRNKWEEIWMIVDTGADYSLLPKYLSWELGVDLKRDCEEHQTAGIGGQENVFLYRAQKVKLVSWQGIIPIGFLENDDVPPLLGRQDFFEKFRVTFDNHKTTFS